ncbi:MAG: UvrD-helicase domain-containing protein [Rikenellaceae bacterium]
MSKIIEGLSQAQKEAVVNFNDPSLIIAGAGSGKTRVLTSRIAYMLEQGVDPRSIMALTFTNKAAKGMRERLEEMIGAQKARAIVMGTFHSVFLRILYENAEILGYSPKFNIFQPSDAKNLIKAILKEMNLSDDTYKPAVVLSRISLAKNSLITPHAYLANPAYQTEDANKRMGRIGELYNAYCQRCKSYDAMDFDDLLLLTNILFKDHPEVLQRYQKQFQYLLVDEFQDTNYAQYIIVRRLSQLHNRVCVVGDDSQSIYSFRGAKIENILNFRNHYPQAKTFKLEQNYRSTQTIVEAANSLISHNKTKLDKKCFSRGEMGEKIGLIRAANDREEAFSVARDILRRVREGASWGDFAILYRTNSQSQTVEQAMLTRSIPYKVYRGSSFYEQKVVKDMLAYIRLVVNQRDDEALKRVINFPARGIGNTTLERIETLAKENNLSMWETIDRLDEQTATDAVQRTILRKVKAFVALIRELIAVGQNSDDPISLYDYGLMIAQRSGILPLHRMSNDPESQSAVESIEELLNTMQKMSDDREELRKSVEQNDGEWIEKGQEEQEGQEGQESQELDDNFEAFAPESMDPPTIEEWLRNVMLLTDQDNDPEDDGERVTLMTVHVSKGLEFEYVYTIGVERALFPSQRAVEGGEIDEERRLFYVAITRAKRVSTLSYCDTRFKWGKTESSYPSPFLREIDPQYLDLNPSNDFRPSRGESATQSQPQQRGRMVSAGRPAYGERRERFERREVEEKREVNLKRIESIPTNRAESGVKYEVDDRIRHERFGDGRVLALSKSGSKEILEVDFESAGIKKIVVELAPIKRI